MFWAIQEILGTRSQVRILVTLGSIAYLQSFNIADVLPGC